MPGVRAVAGIGRIPWLGEDDHDGIAEPDCVCAIARTMPRAVFITLVLLTALAPSGAAAEPCRDAEAPRSGTGWQLHTSCTEGQARPGDRLEIEATGWVILPLHGAERTCVNAGDVPVELVLGGREPSGLSLLRCGQARGALEPRGARSVFVMPFERRGLPSPAAAVIVDAMTARLAGHRLLEVMSEQDVASLLELEQTRQATGCGEEASCIAELAEALGARFVVDGSLSERDGLLFLQGSLLDTVTARVAERLSVEGRTVEELARRAQLLGDNLARAAAGEPLVPIPLLDLGRRLGDVGTMLAAGVVGVVPGAVGLVAAGVPALAAVALPVVAFAAGAQGGSEMTLVLGALGLGAAATVLALLVLPVAAALASMAVDRFDDVEVSWGRSAFAGVAALAAAGLGSGLALLVAVVSGIVVGELAGDRALGGQSVIVAGTAGGGAVLLAAVAGAAAAAGVAYYLGVPLFGDVPLVDDEAEGAE